MEMNKMETEIMEAIAEASMSWEKIDLAGEFDSSAALKVGESLFYKVLGMSVNYYKATVSRIVDGDTLDVTVNLGFGIELERRLQLAGIDAPEVTGEEKEKGESATQMMLDKIPHGTEIIIRIEKVDGFGRYISEVWYDGGTNLNKQMVDSGHAVLNNS